MAVRSWPSRFLSTLWQFLSTVVWRITMAILGFIIFSAIMSFLIGQFIAVGRGTDDQGD